MLLSKIERKLKNLLSHDKKEQLHEFVYTYVVNHQNHENLLSLQTKMSKANEIGLNLTLEFNGESVSLNDIAGVQNTDVFKALEEDIKIYILYLINQITEKQDNMLSEIEFIKNTPLIEDSNSTQSNTNETETSEFNLQVYIEKELLSGLVGEYIDPIEVYQKLVVTNEDITVAEVHDMLRKYVETNQLRIVHYSKCYKCTNGNEKYFLTLPSQIVCDGCGEDIVNVEIRYQIIEGKTQ